MMNGARFTYDDANRAHDEWGANCGPGAIAAALDKTLDEIRPHMGDFEKKHYTNPLLMFAALRSLGVKCVKPMQEWPIRGLVRVQWEGPWTAPGVPVRARYRHTHWIASKRLANGTAIFDINVMCVGGWVPLKEWTDQVVPWLLKEVAPKANGKWHTTHRLELEFPQ